MTVHEGEEEGRKGWLARKRTPRELEIAHKLLFKDDIFENNFRRSGNLEMRFTYKGRITR